MTDRHYEPYFVLDPAAEAARRQAAAAALPAPYPGEGVWVRTAPLPAGAPYLGPRGRRDRGAWLGFLVLATGGSALYLAYAAVIAPEILARPVTNVSVAASSDASTALPPLHRVAAAAPSPVIPPPLPRAPADPPPPPAATPAAWTPVAAPKVPAPSHHRPLAKPARLHEVAARPVRHLPRDTRHPLNWYTR